MDNQKYQKIVDSISFEIENGFASWELYYKRGYYYYLLNNEEFAKSDYQKALSLKMDATEYPYYRYSNSNELRRDFILPEKILVVLILIIVAFALCSQVFSFVYKIKDLI